MQSILPSAKLAKTFGLSICLLFLFSTFSFAQKSVLTDSLGKNVRASLRPFIQPRVIISLEFLNMFGNQARIVQDIFIDENNWISLNSIGYLGMLINPRPKDAILIEYYDSRSYGYGADLLFKHKFKTLTRGRLGAIYFYTGGGAGYHNPELKFEMASMQSFDYHGSPAYVIVKDKYTETIQRLDLMACIGVRMDTKSNWGAGIEIGPMYHISKIHTTAPFQLIHENRFKQNNHGATGFDLWVQFSVGLGFGGIIKPTK